MNKVILAGRLARDPEVRYTQSGKAVATLTLAVSRRFSRNASDQQPTADFIPIVAWEKLADICGQYLHKGSLVYISGRMQTRKWQDKDGGARYTTEIIAQTLRMLSSKNDAARGSGFEPPPMPPDDDVPF